MHIPTCVNFWKIFLCRFACCEHKLKVYYYYISMSVFLVDGQNLLKIDLIMNFKYTCKLVITTRKS